MITQMSGWKVLRKVDRTSCGWSYNQFAIHYPLNQFVIPTLKNSRLFFFEKVEDAQNFVATDSRNLIAVSCVSNSCDKLELAASYPTYIEDFWKFGNDLAHALKTIESIGTNIVYKTPKGTWIAEAIKCLE